MHGSNDSHPAGPAVDIRPLRVLVPGVRRDLDPAGPRVSVVVPAMNEARNLPWLAERMPAHVHEIILVDGNSADDTVAVARRLWPRVRVVGQTRRGKGNALACGFDAVTGDITVMIDADGSMDPGEIPFFVDALVQGADYAKGSRFTVGGGSVDITRLRGLGNQFLNGVTNVGFGATFTDLCYGYNAFWTPVAECFGISPGQAGPRQWGDGFEIETLINIRVHVSGYRVAEVASFETERLFGASNLNAVSDGLRVLRTIAAERRRTPWGGRVRMPQRPAVVLTRAVGVPVDPRVERVADVIDISTTEPTPSVLTGLVQEQILVRVAETRTA